MAQTTENSAGDTITFKKDSLWKYSTFILLAVVLLGAVYVFGGQGVTGNVINNPSQPLPSANERIEIDTGDAPVLGSANAPVTIVEFSDYQCPYCGRHFQETYPLIKSQYVDTGKAKIVFMDFPLGFHEQALPAANVARCAGEQGRYWEMHDLLFENQATLGTETYKNLAQQLGLDMAKFNSCSESGKYNSDIQADQTYGGQVGVGGTPSFFINGKQLEGAQPFSAFKAAIDAELK